MRTLLYSALFISLCLGCQSKKSTPDKSNPEAAATKTKEKVKATPKTPAKSCTYLIHKATPHWTAYKFNSKAPVNGTFKKFTVSQGTTAARFSDALTGLGMKIDGSSIESGDAARNVTVATQFFAKFLPVPNISAVVSKAKGDAEKGTLTINITMNNQTKDVVFSYAREKDGSLLATATIDILNFGLQAAFDSIHTACKGQHTGPDGVSKTWTEVALSVRASVNKECK